EQNSSRPATAAAARVEKHSPRLARAQHPPRAQRSKGATSQARAEARPQAGGAARSELERERALSKRSKEATMKPVSDATRRRRRRRSGSRSAKSRTRRNRARHWTHRNGRGRRRRKADLERRNRVDLALRLLDLPENS